MTPISSHSSISFGSITREQAVPSDGIFNASGTVVVIEWLVDGFSEREQLLRMNVYLGLVLPTSFSSCRGVQ